MKNKLSVIKIGGNIIDDEQALHACLVDFAHMPHPKILVHGGGKLATRLDEKLGIKTEMHHGRRITSEENLETVVMVYAGLINKKTVSILQSQTCNAIGLSGSDANCILATKRPSSPVDFGCVGDVKAVNGDSINLFLDNGMTPVFCAISHDGNGHLFNTNADSVAAEIAIAMSEQYDTELMYCFEKNGVLSDIDDDQSVIQSIDSQRYSNLRGKGVIHAGMLPKMENSFHALRNGVAKVVICHADALRDSERIHTTLTL
ncbi:MAG: acetylglutamate kinase [Bacteroidia bacterium]